MGGSFRVFWSLAAIILAALTVSPVSAVDSAHVQCLSEDADTAIRGCTASLKLKSPKAIADRPYTYGLRARAYQKKGDYARALADHNEAVRIAPKDFLPVFSRGLFFEITGDLGRALADYEAALSLETHYEAHKEGLKTTIARVRSNIAKSGTAVAGSTEAPPSQPSAVAATPKLAAPSPTPTPARDEIAWEFLKATTDVAALRRFLTEFPNSARKSDAEARIATLLREEQARKEAAVIAPPAPVESAKPPAAKPVLPADPGSRVALVIGNGKYRSATPLTNPANDASDVAKALRGLGFEVVEGRDLDKRGMEDKAREFGRKLDKASLALFFYAGHGLQVAGKNYLVPVDAKLERPGDLTFEAIDVAQILAQMEAEQRVNLVLLDACRDNPLARTLARSLGARSATVGQGLATIQSAVGTMIAYATQPDNVALDGEGRNSPFTTALLKHIGTQGLEISSLMKRVRADVIQATRGRQVPWDHSSLIGDVVLTR